MNQLLSVLSNGITVHQLPSGRLTRDYLGRPRSYIGKIGNRYGMWIREYRTKVNVSFETSEYPLGTTDGVSYTVKPRP